MLVLRVWIEAGARAGEGLRARVTSEQELGSGDRVTVAAATVDEIVSIVREWLDSFAAGPVTRR